MRDWLKASLLGTGVFGASWTGAVTYWRAGNRMPSTLDLVGWMLVLPLSLLFAIWLGRRILAARSEASAATPPAANAIQANAAPAPRLPELAILAAAIRTPHGAAPAELAEAISAQRARAGLDPELVDDAGFPLLSARVEDAIDDDFRHDVDAWRIGAALDDPHWTPEQWRALALGTEAASELLLQAIAHPQLVAADEGPGKVAVAPMLRIHAALGPDWNDAQRAAAAAWLANLALQAGWPEERLQAAGQSAPAAVLLSQMATQTGTGSKQVLAAVLAFGSDLGEASVERLALDGKLFSADNPQGLIPGEAAAGLLVASADQAALFGEAAPLLQLSSAPRNTPEANGRKPDTAQLRQLAGPLLPDADDASAVSALFADTSHRSTRLVELMKFAGEVLPALDAGQDLKTTGGACGHCGEAPFLVALALAHQHALDTAGAAFCVGHEHPLQRTAALVRPAAAQS